LNDQKKNNEQTNVHFEDGIPVLEVKSEEERKRAEDKAHDRQYKNDQITLNRRLVGATVALVIATIVLGIASGLQLWYMHRQWKLASDGLSKTGDQVWAAKDAAFAARQAANTSSDILGENKRQFDKTLKQMRVQTTAQQTAANASIGAAATAKKSTEITSKQLTDFENSERAILQVEITYDAQGKTLSYTVKNVGRTAAIGVAWSIGGGSMICDEPNVRNPNPAHSSPYGFTVPQGETTQPEEFAQFVDPKILDEDRKKGTCRSFIVVIGYQDVFGNEQRTSACLHWAGLGGLQKCSIVDDPPRNKHN
jgi:hypothetical protein